jgi:hypothetical protein
MDPEGKLPVGMPISFVQDSTGNRVCLSLMHEWCSDWYLLFLLQKYQPGNLPQQAFAAASVSRGTAASLTFCISDLLHPLLQHIC